MWNDDDDDDNGDDGDGDGVHLGKRVAICCRARDIHLFPLLHLDIGDHF